MSEKGPATDATKTQLRSETAHIKLGRGSLARDGTKETSFSIYQTAGGCGVWPDLPKRCFAASRIVWKVT